MKPGEFLETAIWLAGTETEDQVRRWRSMVEELFGATADQGNVILGEINWAILPLEDERVPPVPPHVQGPDIRLLVASAPIVSMRQRFTDDLGHRDLAQLRQITRKAYERHWPELVRENGPLTDAQCDTLINDLGPETVWDDVRLH